MKNQNRDSYVKGRGPVMGNPDAGLYPDPWSEPFTVPKASPFSWIKGVAGLAVIVGLTIWVLGGFS